jgi:hypothetical protein
MAINKPRKFSLPSEAPKVPRDERVRELVDKVKLGVPGREEPGLPGEYGPSAPLPGARESRGLEGEYGAPEGSALDEVAEDVGRGYAPVSYGEEWELPSALEGVDSDGLALGDDYAVYGTNETNGTASPLAPRSEDGGIGEEFDGRIPDDVLAREYGAPEGSALDAVAEDEGREYRPVSYGEEGVLPAPPPPRLMAPPEEVANSAEYRDYGLGVRAVRVGAQATQGGQDVLPPAAMPLPPEVANSAEYRDYGLGVRPVRVAPEGAGSPGFVSSRGSGRKGVASGETQHIRFTPVSNTRNSYELSQYQDYYNATENRTGRPVVFGERALQQASGVGRGAGALRSGAAERFVSEFQRMFGKRVVFFKASAPIGTNAVTSSAAPDTILVNVDTSRPLAALLGHELTHQIEVQDPVLFGKISRAIASLAAMPRRYARERQGGAGYDAQEVPREWVSDVVGQRFNEARFWWLVRAEMARMGELGAFRQFVQVFLDFSAAFQGIVARTINPNVEVVNDKLRVQLANYVAQYAVGRQGKRPQAPLRAPAGGRGAAPSRVEFATRGVPSSPPALRLSTGRRPSEGEGNLFLDRARRAFPGLFEALGVRIGRLRDELAALGVENLPPDVDSKLGAYVRRAPGALRRGERDLLLIALEAARDPVLFGETLGHEGAHAYLDTLPPEVVRGLWGEFERETGSRTGPLYRAGAPHSTMRFEGLGFREWFAERVREANSRWLRDRVNPDASLLSRVLGGFRDVVHAVYARVTGDTDVFSDGFRAFVARTTRRRPLPFAVDVARLPASLSRAHSLSLLEGLREAPVFSDAALNADPSANFGTEEQRGLVPLYPGKAGSPLVAPGYRLAKRGGALGSATRAASERAAAELVGALVARAPKVWNTMIQEARALGVDVVVPAADAHLEGGGGNSLPLALANRAAMDIGAHRGAPVAVVLPGRVSKSGSLSRMNFQQRLDADIDVEMGGGLAGSRVLVVDDVFTTGKTTLSFVKAVVDSGGDPVLLGTLSHGTKGSQIKATPEQRRLFLAALQEVGLSLSTFQEAYDYDIETFTGTGLLKLGGALLRHGRGNGGGPFGHRGRFHGLSGDALRSELQAAFGGERRKGERRNRANPRPDYGTRVEYATPSRGAGVTPPGTSAPRVADSEPFEPAPRGTAPWLDVPAQSWAGRRLVALIRGDRMGEKYGWRSIQNFLLERFPNVKFLISRSQTTRRNPGHYQPELDVIMARTGASPTLFSHELGHYIHRRLTEAGWAPPVGFVREDFTVSVRGRKSFASANNDSEAVAEWVRRYIVDPASVVSHPLTRSIEGFLGNYELRITNYELAGAGGNARGGVVGGGLRDGPALLGALRDAARAWQANLGRAPSAQFHALNADVSAPGQSLGALRAALRGRWHSFLAAFVGRGHAVRKLEADAFRALAARDVAAARIWRRERGAQVLNAYSEFLGCNGIVQGAYLGRGGLVVNDSRGRGVKMTRCSWREIVERVPDGKWSLFESGGWARTMLARHKRGLDYPGSLDGWTPEALARQVELARAEIADFDGLYKEVQGFMRGVLQLELAAGLKSEEEVARMTGEGGAASRGLAVGAAGGFYGTNGTNGTNGTASLLAPSHPSGGFVGDYWPLPRVRTAEYEGAASAPAGGRLGLETDAGTRRAKGSLEAVVSLNEAVEKRLTDAVRAYQWEMLKEQLVRTAVELRGDRRLDVAWRDQFAQMFIPLRKASRVVATLSPQEQARIVAEAAARAGITLTDSGTGERRAVTEEDVDILGLTPRPVTRAEKPREFSVLTLYRGDDVEFVHVGDPLLLQMLLWQSSRPNALVSALNGLLRPYVTEFKKVVTQNWVFAVRNLFRDPFSSMILTDGRRQMLPFQNIVRGIVGRLRGESEGVRPVTELYTRELSGSASALSEKLDRNAFQEIWLDGWWRSGVKNQEVGLAFDVLMNTAMLPLKALSTVNLVTGGAWFAAQTESLGREGAALSALDSGASEATARRAYQQSAGEFAERPLNGSWAGWIQTVPFFNPVLQITRQTWARYSDPDPAVRASAWVKTGIGGVILPALAWAAARAIFPQDDEERRRNAERPVSERMRYMQIGGVRLPFAEGIMGSLQAAVWNALDAAFEGAPVSHQREAAGQLLLTASGLPDGPGSFLPYGFRQAVEVLANHDFLRGRPIVSQMQLMLPAGDQVGERTPRIYEALADTWVGRGLDVSPLRLQHAAQGLYGYQLGNTLLLADRIARGLPATPTARDVPFVGQLFASDPRGWASASVQDIGEMANAAAGIKSRLARMGLANTSAEAIDSLAGNAATAEAGDNLRALAVQLRYCEAIRSTAGLLSRASSAARKLRAAGRLDEAREVERRMTLYSMRVLAGHPDAGRAVERAGELARAVEDEVRSQVDGRR